MVKGLGATVRGWGGDRWPRLLFSDNGIDIEESRLENDIPQREPILQLSFCRE